MCGSLDLSEISPTAAALPLDVLRAPAGGGELFALCPAVPRSGEEQDLGKAKPCFAAASRPRGLQLHIMLVGSEDRMVKNKKKCADPCRKEQGAPMAVSLLSPARFSERFGRRFGDLQLHQVAEDRGSRRGGLGVRVQAPALPPPCPPLCPHFCSGVVAAAAPRSVQRAGSLRALLALLRLHLFRCRGYRGDIIDDDDDNGSRGDRWQINS